MTKRNLGIVLGHNSFFGVDHLSTSRGSTREAYFSDPQKILEIVRFAHQEGADGLMMSTHARAEPIARAIAEDTLLSESLAIYPLLPYAQKYVTKANEVGMVNAVLGMVSSISLRDKLSLIMTGSKAVISRDLNSVLSALIRVELATISKCRMPAVFLHDAFTDLALAFGLKDIFMFYQDEIDRLYNAEAAFATKNLPFLLDKFEEWNLDSPLLMVHLNKVGFGVCPSKEECEKVISDRSPNLLVMSSLASGYLDPPDAYQYLGAFESIKGIVVGASSQPHIRETFESITEHLPQLKKKQHKP